MIFLRNEILGSGGGSKGVRYIRESMNGSNLNPSNHWVEIEAYDNSQTNVALYKPVTNSMNRNGSEKVTDGSYSSGYLDLVGGVQWVIIDLLSVFNLTLIKCWHYYADRRTYKEVKLQVSADGINWRTIFDSEVNGRYAETPEGKTHIL